MMRTVASTWEDRDGVPAVSNESDGGSALPGAMAPAVAMGPPMESGRVLTAWSGAFRAGGHGLAAAALPAVRQSDRSAWLIGSPVNWISWPAPSTTV